MTDGDGQGGPVDPPGGPSPAPAGGSPRPPRHTAPAVLRAVRPWAQYLLTAAVAAVIFWRTDLRATWNVLHEVDPLWAVAGVLALALSNVVHAVKWQKLLSGLGRVPLREALAVFWASMATNNVFPLRAGDVLRVDVLARRNRLPRAGVVATLLSERVLDAICFLLILLAAFAILTSSASQFYLVGLVLAALVAVSLAATVALARRDPVRPLAANRLFRRLPAPVHRLADRFLPGFLRGLQPLGQFRSGGEVFLWALGAWALESAAFAAFGRAFGLELALGTYLLVMVVVNFVSSLTILPANLGIFEIASIGVLQASGAGAGEATGYAVGSHILVFVTISAGGLAALAYLRLTLPRHGARQEVPARAPRA